MRKISLLLKLVLMLFVWAGVSSFGQDTAKAAAPVPQSTIPDSGSFDQGSRVNLITAIYGNGYVLDSPTNVVRLYSPTPNNTINIINGGNCPGQG